jgi:hypothetical protein
MNNIDLLIKFLSKKGWKNVKVDGAWLVSNGIAIGSISEIEHEWKRG